MGASCASPAATLSGPSRAAGCWSGARAPQGLSGSVLAGWRCCRMQVRDAWRSGGSRGRLIRAAVGPQACRAGADDRGWLGACSLQTQAASCDRPDQHKDLRAIWVAQNPTESAASGGCNSARRIQQHMLKAPAEMARDRSHKFRLCAQHIGAPGCHAQPMRTTSSAKQRTSYESSGNHKLLRTHPGSSSVPRGRLSLHRV